MNSSKKYSKSVGLNQDFVQTEENILEFWNENQIFEKSLEKTKNQKEYIFYDGPPFANGLPHYGHLLTSCAKDVIGRFQTMNERYVGRIFGWDCHGLPAEMAAEKTLGVSGRKEIEEFGIEKFNDHCKNDVMKFSCDWEKYITKIGRWTDMKNAYKTMDLNFMESILWAFKNLYDQGLVYRQMKVMPYSWACQTSLSNFETRLDNSYREKESKSIIVKFEICKQEFLKRFSDLGFDGFDIEKIFILVWTTTPWTLPSNLALAISSDLEYELVFDADSKKAFIARECSEKFLKDLKIEINKEKKPKNFVVKIKGERLQGLSYVPLFDYFAKNASEASFKIFHAGFVTAGDGTGVVHIAPGFGEEDFELCLENQIGIFDEKESLAEKLDSKKIFPAVPVDDDGKFLEIVKDFAGLHVFDANDQIIKALKISEHWVKTLQYFHPYPHCWRTDTPIIYKAMPSYYIEVSKFKERLCALNSKINWIPGGVKDGIFGNWLKEAKDWAISRNRFFGTPIPVWISSDEKYPCTKVFGSLKELEEFFGPFYETQNPGKKLKILDLHRPFVDELVAPNPLDPTKKSFLKRIPDVFDCWFESGAMSFAENHYPFNQNSHCGPTYDTKEFDPKIHKPKRLPADFIVEYTAQTRGWFYTLTVLSALIFDEIPFKNCICHGVILDEKGQKLSKRLGNYIDPLQAMKGFGADALRIIMLSSPVMGGGELLIDKEGKMLLEALKTFQKPLASALNFFVLYAHEDQPQLTLLDLSDLGIWTNLLKSKTSDSKENLEYDFFILFEVFNLSYQIYKNLSEYKIMNAYLLLRDFIDDLNNFYIRANRDRFWKGGMSQDKQRAFNTLYSVLHTLSITIAPILPFFAENLFQRVTDDFSNSVHLQKFIFTSDDQISQKAFDEIILKNKDFFESMKILKKIFYHGRAIRDDKLGIRIRQPLKTCKIITNIDLINKNFEFFKKEISSELNFHEVFLIQEKTALDQVSQFFSRKTKINTRLLGPKLGSDIIKIKKLLDSGEFEIFENSLKIGGHVFVENEFFTEIHLNKNFEKNSSIAWNEKGQYLIVWIDDFMDQDLALEGMMRDLVRSIQDGRKTILNITDRIELFVWFQNPDIKDLVSKFKKYIMDQTLAQKFEYRFFDSLNEQEKFENSLIDSGFGIFGYNVLNSFTKKDIDIKIAFRKI